jgi:hypothetical protein
LRQENRHTIHRLTDEENFVFADPLLPFGTVREANAHCTHLQITHPNSQTEICKRVQSPTAQEQSSFYFGVINLNQLKDFRRINCKAYLNRIFKLRLFLLILFIFISIVLFGQKPQNLHDRDSIGNLWIITFDKSGSMTNNKSISTNTRNTLNKLNPVYDLINFEKDRFTFYNTGILTENDISELKYQEKFEKSFIHEYNANEKLYEFEKFRDSYRLGLYIESKLKIPDNYIWNTIYKYRYSFVSLIRPMALSHSINRFYYKNNDGDTINKLKRYNRIFILSITDDADINDQWLTDYKTVEKYAPNKLNEINTTLDRLIVSPFNFLAKPTGKFIPVFEEEGNWKIFLHEYLTYESIDDSLEYSDFIQCNQITDTSIVLSFMTKEINSFKAEFCQIDQCFLNNKRINTKKYFWGHDTIAVHGFSNKEKNSLVIRGAYQVSYNDKVLGKRSKKLFFTERMEFYSNTKIIKDRNRKTAFIVTVSILLLTLLFWYLVYRPRQILFEIFDNLGNHLIVMRGFPFAFSPKFKRIKCLNNINHISSYPINLIENAKDYNKVIISSFDFLQQRFNQDYAKKLNDESITIYVKSKFELDISSKPKKIAYTDIKKFTNGNYEKLTSGGKGDEVLNQIIKKCNSKTYLYYLIPINQENNKGDIEIEIKSQRKRNKAFILSFLHITSNKEEDEKSNQKFNLLCINEQFAKKRKHNGLIILNKIGNDLIWNIIAFNHNGDSHNFGNPIDLYHFFEYRQLAVSNVDINEIMQTLNLLKNEIKQSKFLNIDYVTVYLNNTKIEHDFFEVRIDNQFDDAKKFRITESNFKSFLYLRETKLQDADSIEKQLYTPFDIEARRKNIYKESPPEGDYYLFSTLHPLEKLNISDRRDANYLTKLSDDVISISHQSDIEVIFQEEKVVFLNYEIEIQ